MWIASCSLCVPVTQNSNEPPTNSLASRKCLTSAPVVEAELNDTGVLVVGARICGGSELSTERSDLRHAQSRHAKTAILLCRHQRARPSRDGGCRLQSQIPRRGA